MAASRATSLRALKQISKSTNISHTQTRGLRITPHPEASPYLTTQKPSLARVQVAIDDAAAEVAKAATVPNTRQFNTSRSLKAVNDSSTIDFAFLPDFDPDTGLNAGPAVRVPLLPASLYPQSTKTSYTKEEQEIVSTLPLAWKSSGAILIRSPPGPQARDTSSFSRLDLPRYTKRIHRSPRQQRDRLPGRRGQAEGQSWRSRRGDWRDEAPVQRLLGRCLWLEEDGLGVNSF